MRFKFMTLVALTAVALPTAAARRTDRVGERIVQAETVRVLSLEEIEAWRGKAITLDAPNPNAIYSNKTTTLGKYLQQGPAALGVDRMLMDDITLTTPATGGGIGEVTFTIFNPFPYNVSPRLRVRFWNADGAPLGPGLPNAPGTYYIDPVTTQLAGFSSPPFPLIPGLNTIRLWNPGGFLINVPFPSTFTFWAGITFSNDGGSTATETELSAIGQGLFGPPEVGSSADILFQTNAAGHFLGVNNPAGTAFHLDAAPLAHLGWEFVFGPGPPVLH